MPYREKVGADGIGPAVQRLLTVVLNNDPLILKGPEANTWLRRQGRALERRSVMHFGGELYELAARLGSSFDTLPGVAIIVRREVSALHVGARLGGAFNPGNDPDRLQLRAQFDAQIEAALYASPSENTSLFASALLGLVHQRFEGPAPFDGPGATGTATSSGLSLGLRGGVETMRTSDVHLLAFLQPDMPAFISHDIDHGVVDQWVPSARARRRRPLLGPSPPPSPAAGEGVRSGPLAPRSGEKVRVRGPHLFGVESPVSRGEVALTSYRMARRSFLRACGGSAALLLPLLRDIEARANGAAAPLRFLVIQKPLGVQWPLWRPTAHTATTTNFTLPVCSAPFEPLRSKMAMIDGLTIVTRRRPRAATGATFRPRAAWSRS